MPRPGLFEILDVAVLILPNKMPRLSIAQNTFRSLLIRHSLHDAHYPMMFIIEILGEPDSHGNARVIERRAHTGPNVTEALRTARINLRSPPPSAYSFSMRIDGREVGRWRRSDDDDRASVLDDIKAAKSRSHAGNDEK